MFIRHTKLSIILYIYIVIMENFGSLSLEEHDVSTS
jgi:hypothetical protein